ncbi:MAG: LysR family transcriptional regulator [Rhizobiaceae bacterium MnEN-MB40S]|nr:MAG: LysR family transcriptional regulator [Rhizobiaceae bacterium MnEN-MB40S]
MNNIERLPIDSDLLHTFVTIARYGNLTAAAGRLHRTQSAISVQLRKLESGLATSLFARTPRGMTLTPAGEKLLPRAQAILTGIREAAELFDEPLTGSIRVGLPDDFDETLLEQILGAFSRAHPGVHVEARSGCTSTYPEKIDSGLLDLAVCSSPDNRLGKALGTEATVWAAKTGAVCREDDVAPLAILDRNCWWRNLPTDALDAAGRGYTIAFRSSSFASLQAAIRAGFAIGVLPEYCLGSGLTALSKNDGFPELPSARRSIAVSKDAPADLASAMAMAISEAWSNRVC